MRTGGDDEAAPALRGGASDGWIDALGRSSLFRGAELRADDHGVEVSRGTARALLRPCAALPDAQAVAEALASGDTALLLIGAAPSWLAKVPQDQAPIALLADDPAAEVLCLTVHGLLERAELRRNAQERIRELARYRYERGELVEIARAIARERDTDRLLSSILEKSRYVTGADAGSIYVVEGDRSDPASHTLHFKMSQNDSMTYPSSEFTMPVSTSSIAGATVVTREAINIADVYDLDERVPYRFDRSFDERTGYRTRSILAVPMISAEDDVIGVIQLINKKRSPRAKLSAPEQFEQEVVPFDARSAELLAALAAQAGIALENALLYQEIRDIFEGFVTASVQAIEQRDPTTSGHSQRVSVLSCRLAEKVDRADSGAYREASFSRRDLQELKYAALLHDFGKIGVREQVLVKAKKLYPHERDAIRTRVELALQAAELDLLREKLALIERGAGEADLRACTERHAQRRAQLMDAWSVIERADEPTVLSEGDFSRIAEIAAITFPGTGGEAQRLLNEAEAIALKITRGSLSPSEISEIRSHVVHTYNFLTKIPWGKTMARIPEIARAHHEKLNGTGYPLGMPSQDIPLQSKIMTVADIYDALTASDRPYKKALASERALQILDFEVKDGNLDAELVRIFREAEVHKLADRALPY
jgi:HD-GYP domain-containing protein (c-di-GMP phosphodiesterase class II)